MLTALLLTATAAINVAETRPLPVVLLAPSGALSAIEASALFRGLSERIEQNTALKIDPQEPERIAECGGELVCLIERTGSASPLLLIISAVKAKNGDRVSATLVDADVAREEMRKSSPGRTGRSDREALETLVSERATLVRPQWAEVKDARGLETFLDALMREHLEAVLRARDAWVPHAKLRLLRLPAGTAITIDGAHIGFAEAEETQIIGIKPGKRAIALEHPGHDPLSLEVELLRGQETELSLVLAEHREDVSGLRTALLWTGVGASAIGTAVAAYGAAHAGGSRVVCLTDDPAGSQCAGRSEFYSAGGVALAPLGYSILSAGAVWSLGALLFGDDHQVPWLELILGTGIGLAVYTTSILLDGETP
jgi:hypothetical protein